MAGEPSPSSQPNTKNAPSAQPQSNKRRGVTAGQIITIIVLIVFALATWAVLFYFRSSSRDLPAYDRSIPAENLNSADTTADVDTTDTVNTNVAVNTNAVINTNTASGAKNTNTATEADDNEKPLPPDVPVWDDIENVDLGVRLSYPDIFKYGVKSSSKGAMIQITTYDPSDQVPTDAFDTFPGMKLEMFKEANTSALSVLEYAASVSGGDEPTVTFQDLTIDGRTALQDFKQNNSFTTVSYYIDEGDEFYVIFIVADNQDYENYGVLLDDMIDSIEFDI